jgi:hypothetical protein
MQNATQRHDLSGGLGVESSNLSAPTKFSNKSNNLENSAKRERAVSMSNQPTISNSKIVNGRATEGGGLLMREPLSRPLPALPIQSALRPKIATPQERTDSLSRAKCC